MNGIKERPTIIWLEKKGLTSKRVCDFQWFVFLLCLGSSAVFLVILSIATTPIGLPHAALLMFLASFTMPSIICAILRMQSSHEERRFMEEAPRVVGCMAMSMHLQPSMEKALSFACEKNDGALAEQLRRMSWESLVKFRRSASDSLLEFVSILSNESDALRQSMHLLIASAQEVSKEGREKLLDKSNTVILNGIRQASDRYVSSLSFPTMLLFSLGTLLPVMLFTLLPLMSMAPTSIDGGMEGDASASMWGASVLLVVIFPLASFILSYLTINKNPMPTSSHDHCSVDKRSITVVFALALCGMMVSSIFPAVDWAFGQLFLIILPPCMLLAYRTRKERTKEGKRTLLENDFISSLYQIGIRLTSGSTLERSMQEMARSRPGSAFSDFSSSLIHRSRITNRSVRQLMSKDRTFKEASPLIGSSYAAIAECTVINPTFAGQLAVNLAQQLSNIRAYEVQITERLKGVVDMMESTSMVFAPIVLAVTGSLFGIISSISSINEFIWIMGAYLIELNFIISYYTAGLHGQRSWNVILYRFSSRTPIALVIFAAAFIMCQSGLSSFL